MKQKELKEYVVSADLLQAIADNLEAQPARQSRILLNTLYALVQQQQEQANEPDKVKGS